MSNEYLTDLRNAVGEIYDKYKSPEKLNLNQYRKPNAADDDTTLAIYNGGDCHWRILRVYERVKITGTTPDNKEPFEMSINLEDGKQFVHFALLHRINGDQYNALAKDTFSTKEELINVIIRNVTKPCSFE